MSDNVVLDARRKALEEEYFNRKNVEALDRLKKSLGLGTKVCPVSGEPLKGEVFNGVLIYRSPATQGVWIESDDLKVLLEARQKDQDIKWDETFFKKLVEESKLYSHSGALRVAEIDESIRISPSSQKPMAKLNVCGVIVDRCPVSGGMWFDLGEINSFLEKASESHETSLGTWLNNFFKMIVG